MQISFRVLDVAGEVVNPPAEQESASAPLPVHKWRRHRTNGETGTVATTQSSTELSGYVAPKDTKVFNSQRRTCVVCVHPRQVALWQHATLYNIIPTP